MLALVSLCVQSGQQVRPADADRLPRYHREPEQPRQLAGKVDASLGNFSRFLPSFDLFC